MSILHVTLFGALALPRTPESNFIADELLKALLKRQRVLVILDHVSEMSDQSYDKMKQALSETPVNALIITSRLREKDFLGFRAFSKDLAGATEN